MKKIHLGVDVGSHAVKVCSVDSSGTSCQVSQHLLMPDRTCREDTLSGSALLWRLQEILAPLKARGKTRVHVAVEDSTIATGYLELPKLSGEQQKVAVPSAVAREIPHALQEVQLFTTPVPPLSAPTQQGIFFVAVPKAVHEGRMQLLAQAGMEVSDCEPGVLATLRGITRNLAPTDQQVTGLICCGFSTTSVILLKGAHPYFCRDFRMAGSDFTYAFQMGDQVTWAEAETAKLAYNVAARDFKVESFLEQWLSQVQRSLAYARQKLPMLVPERILLTGGSALWQGLPERLSETLNLPVTRQTWSKLRPASSSGPSEIVFFDQALGLVSHA